MAETNIVRRAAANTGIIFFGQILSKLISLVVIVYLARYLGKVGFGKYSLVFAYLGFFSVLVDFGLGQILVRELAGTEKPDRILFGNAIMMKLVLSVFSVILAWSIALFLNYPLSTKILIFIASFSLLFSYQSPSFGDVFTTIFTVNLSRVYVTIIDLLSRSLIGASILLLIFYRRSLTEIILVNILGLFPGFLVLIYISQKFLRPQFSLDFKIWKFLLKESFPLALSSIFVMVYFRIDVILLSLWKGEGAVGLYSAAFKLTEAFTLLGSALTITLLPVASHYYKSVRESFEMAYRLSLKYVAILMIPIGIGAGFYSHQIINLLYGAKFSSSSSALAILIWAELFMLLNMSITTFLISTYRQNIFSIAAFSLMIINVGLNYFLIPSFSFIGASIATLLTEGVFTVFGLVYLAKFEGLYPSPSLVKLIPVNILFILFLFLFAHLPLFSVVSVSIFVYPILLLVFRNIDNVELDILKKIFVKV